MKKRLVSLLLALALLVLPVLPAFAAEEDSYTYVALGDSITTGVGLKDTHFSSTAKSYDVQENYHDYSKDCYVARVADALGLDRDHAVNYGMPAEQQHPGPGQDRLHRLRCRLLRPAHPAAGAGRR